MSTATFAAQSSALSVVQSTDGTLYLQQGSNVWTLVPDQMRDADLAALTPSGEMDGAIPAPFLGSPGSPTALEVVQADDGTLHIVQASNVWTLVPNQISDTDLGTLTPVGEVDGTLSTTTLALGAPSPAPEAPQAASPTAASDAAPPAPTVVPTSAPDLGPMERVIGLAADPTGGLYVADAHNFHPRILHFSGTSTTPDASVDGRGYLDAIAVDASGGLYGENTNEQVLYFSNARDAKPARIYGQPPAGQAVSASFLGPVVSVTVDPAGGVYIGSDVLHRVLHFSGTGTVADRVYGQNGSFTSAAAPSVVFGTLTASTLSVPIGLAVDSSGGVYIADQYDHRVLHFSGASTTADRVYGQTGSFTTNGGGLSASALLWPQAVVADPSGGIYVAEANSTNRVLHFPGTNTTADRVYGTHGSFTTRGTEFGTDVLAADPSGGLYVGDTNGFRVLHFSGTSTTPDRTYGKSR